MNKISYYFLMSERRKLLDKHQEEATTLYKGKILDIGGRDRGGFNKPKKNVKEWIFADIVKEHNPDLVLDVANMKVIPNNSIDVINAMELFEHVKEVEKGLSECYRVLKKGGTILISCPFLYRVHGDPYDYQRYTDQKWAEELKKIGFKKINITIMGKFFTVLVDMKKTWIRSWILPLRILGYLTFPALDLLKLLDNTLKNNKLSKFHGGYFIVARK